MVRYVKKEKKKKKKNPTSRLSFFVILFCKKEMFFSLKKIRVVNTRKKMREKGDTKKQTINGILFSENQNKIRNHIRRTKRCVRAMFNYLTIFSLSPSPSIITICAAGIVEFERKRDRKRKRRNFLILLPKKNSLPAPVHASDGVLVSIVVNVGVLVSKFVNPNEAS